MAMSGTLYGVNTRVSKDASKGGNCQCAWPTRRHNGSVTIRGGLATHVGPAVHSVQQYLELLHMWQQVDGNGHRVTTTTTVSASRSSHRSARCLNTTAELE